MSAETTTQAAGSHGCPVHGMGGWQDMAWTGPATRGRLVRRGSARTEAVRLGHSWLVRLGKARSGLATRGMDGWSGMAGRSWIGAAGMERRGVPGETRSGRPGDAVMGKDRQAWRRMDGQRLSRLGWRGSALLRSDGPGAAGMARWACNVAAGMDRHDQVGVKPRGRHGVARSGCASAASQAWHGLALQGLALRGWLGSSWKRFARLVSAGMAANATTW